jgi:eukaryotic-like serine/threonine-protein kinase
MERIRNHERRGAAFNSAGKRSIIGTAKARPVRELGVMDSKPFADKIGRYEVEELVGEGAMAQVYRARDPEIGRTVAIKLLKEEFCVDEEYVTRFLREARAAGAISHPNIVTVFDVGRSGTRPYITMEFLDESSLADQLAAGTKFGLKEILNLGIQLARALDHAHARGIVHRDVKPGNIMLFQHAQVAKITDFGIARLDRSDDLQKTNAGTILGTPRYMSPEQAAGKELDGRSDLFSLGAIFYELLTGKKAFDSPNVATLILQIMQKDPEPIRTLAPGVPVGLRRSVNKLLSKSPERRFGTGAELAKALERELASIEAQEEEAKRNRFIPLRLKWVAMVGGVLSIVLIASMSIVYYIEARVIRNQVIDSGAALAKLVAQQTAVPVLGQNWVPLESFVADASARGTFDYLAVTDHDHVVKAATAKELVGKAYAPLPGATTVVKASDFTASSVSLPDGRDAMLFETPILFQKTEIGRLYLGVSQDGVNRVLRSMLMMLSSLGLLTVLSAIAMLYVFGKLLERPLRLLTKSLEDFGGGDTDRRISEVRNDELGQVFTAFNHMAAKIQARFVRRAGEVHSLSAEQIANLAHAEADAEATMLTASVRVEPTDEPAS